MVHRQNEEVDYHKQSAKSALVSPGLLGSTSGLVILSALLDLLRLVTYKVVEVLWLNVY